MIFVRLLCSIVGAVLVFTQLLVFTPPASAVDGDYGETISAFRKVSTEDSGETTRSASNTSGGVKISVNKTEYADHQSVPLMNVAVPNHDLGTVGAKIEYGNGQEFRRCFSWYGSCFRNVKLTAPLSAPRTYKVTVYHRGVATVRFITITNRGWVGTVSKVVDRTSYTSVDPEPRAKLEANPNTVRDGWFSLYNESGRRLCVGKTIGETCFQRTRLTAGLDKPAKYFFFVASHAPGSAFPTRGVKKKEVVTITNQGWVGTVSKVVDRTTYTSADPVPTAKLEANPNTVRYGWFSLYNESGRRLCVGKTIGELCFQRTRLTAGLDKPAKYFFFVASHAPGSAFPTRGVKKKEVVTITNQGWVGSISTEVHKPKIAGDIRVTIKASPALPSYLALWYVDSSTGKKHKCSSSGVCSASIGRNASTSLVAFVDSSSPSSSNTTNPKALAVASFIKGEVQAQRSFNTVQTKKVANAKPKEWVPKKLLEKQAKGQATHKRRSTVSDQILLYMTLVRQGMPKTAALLAAMASCRYCQDSSKAGVEKLVDWLSKQGDKASEPECPHGSAGDCGPGGGGKKPNPGTGPATGTKPGTGNGTKPAQNRVQELEERAFQSIMRRRGNFDKRNPDVSDGSKKQRFRAAAKQCVRRVLAARAAASKLQAGDKLSEDACETHSILFSGNSERQITNHIRSAIKSTPVWVRLNYVARDTANGGKGTFRHGWYRKKKACLNKKSGQDCDEYPFGSSAQGGPAQPPVNKDASLRKVDSQQNSRHGGLYGGMRSSCRFKSGGKQATAMNPRGTPFLVIPLDSKSTSSTFFVCGTKK